MSANTDDAGLELGLPGQPRFPAAKGRTPLRPLDAPPLKLRTMHDKDEPVAVPADLPAPKPDPRAERYKRPRTRMGMGDIPFN